LAVPPDLIGQVRDLEIKGSEQLRTGDYSNAVTTFTEEYRFFLERQKADPSLRIHKGSPLYNLGLSLLFGGEPFKGLQYILLAYIEDIISQCSRGGADNLPASSTLRSILSVPTRLLRELENAVLEKNEKNAHLIYPEENLAVFGSLIETISKYFSKVSELYKFEIEAQKWLERGNFKEAQQAYDEWLSQLFEYQNQIVMRVHKGHQLHNAGICLFSQQKYEEALKKFFLAYVEDVLSAYSLGIANTLPAYRTLKDGFKINPALLRGIESLAFEKKSRNEVPDPADVTKEYESLLSEEEKKLDLSLKEIIKSKEENEKKLLEGFKSTKTPENSFNVLRRWNSSTPRYPVVANFGRDGRMGNVGGGYFLWWDGRGVAIDPGYDFLPLFFRERFGVNHIDAIIASHAHDDHTQDIETIFSLVYKMNKKLQQNKQIDLFGSEGVRIKYSRLTDVTGTFSQTLTAGSITNLASRGYNFSIEAVKTDHNEQPWMSNNTGVGVILELHLPDGKGIFKIGLTSDTRFWDGMEKAFEKANLLVVHLGTIGDSQSMHLQEEGCRRLIAGVNPRLAIISEFGKELQGQRCNICERMKTWISQTGATNQEIPILPGDIGLRIKLPSLKVYCENTNDYQDCDKVTTFEKGPKIYYLDKNRIS